MSDCLFCNLIDERKVNFIYEDEEVAAFPDIDPRALHHILIVPKQHIASVLEFEPEDENLAGHLLHVGKQIAQKLGVDQSGFRLVINTGPDAGQSVFHLHMHLLGGQPLGPSTQPSSTALDRAD